MKHTLELMALEWAMNRFAANLLPPCSRFFITYDEVLIVNACKVEVKNATVDR